MTSFGFRCWLIERFEVQFRVSGRLCDDFWSRLDVDDLMRMLSLEGYMECRTEVALWNPWHLGISPPISGGIGNLIHIRVRF